MTDKEKETEMVEEEPKVETTEDKAESLDDLKAELDATRKALSKANREAAQRRKQLDDFEAAEAKRKESEMTEVEKLQKERDEAKEAAKVALKEAHDKLLRADVLSQATAMDFAHPEIVYPVLRDSLDALEAADDGSFPGLGDLLKELAKKYPSMLKQGKGGPKLGATNPEGATQGNETDEQRRKRLFG